ncbi:hypothetical protein LCGC14_1588140 [marine sediment metagenome]|uniref:Uncharacterized protein n=1 Tax=marine sediment metagenome TaxID=412755 RepID=A0A0F9IF61_9ZZZZ
MVDLKIWKSKPYVLDEMKFNRFNRQNTIFSRVSNDPQFPSFKKGIYSSHEMIIEQIYLKIKLLVVKNRVTSMLMQRSQVRILPVVKAAVAQLVRALILCSPVPQ